MKRSLLVAVGLALALSVGAQTNEEKKPEKKRKAKTEENAQAVPEKVQPGARAKAHPQMEPAEHRTAVQSHEAGQTNRKAHSSQQTVAKNQQQTGGVTRSTTVFKNGHKTSEHVSVRRETREASDVHFKIGSHPREWWLRSYTVVLLDGCYYYLADNGYWYPAYGFAPGCTYPVGVVYISF